MPHVRQPLSWELEWTNQTLFYCFFAKTNRRQSCSRVPQSSSLLGRHAQNSSGVENVLKNDPRVKFFLAASMLARKNFWHPGYTSDNFSLDMGQPRSHSPLLSYPSLAVAMEPDPLLKMVFDNRNFLITRSSSTIMAPMITLVHSTFT